jgi:hypothetical protein
LTNFIQPVYTLHTPRGSNQSPQFERLPSTQTENFNAFGRQKANNFEYKVVYPNAMKHQTHGFSNIRPTTVTPAQNQMTGQHLYQSTKGNDPRVDNTKEKPYNMANMDIQQTFFSNPSGAVIAAGALIAFALFVSRR